MYIQQASVRQINIIFQHYKKERTNAENHPHGETWWWQQHRVGILIFGMVKLA